MTAGSTEGATTVAATMSVKVCTGTETETTGHTTTAAQVTSAAIILQVKEAWRVMYKAMTSTCAPEIVQAAANAALQETAKYWAFRA